MTEARTRIYLDLDGVVYPIAPLDEASVDRGDVDLLHEHEWWRKSVVRRLGSLGSEIVMASSWGTIFMRQPFRSSPLNILKPARALAIGPLFEENISKVEAVVRDLQQDPMPFVWIDDHLSQAMIDTVKESIPKSTPGLYVRPYKMQGLTNDEITAIEKGFLESDLMLRVDRPNSV